MRILKIAEYLGYVIWGVNVFEFVALQGIGHINRVFPTLNSDLVTVSTVVGLLVIILNAWIRFDKHQIDKKLEEENLRALHNKNIADELNNFTFDQIIKSQDFETEFKNSAKRLKNN